MSSQSTSFRNPKRVAAGKLNRLKRGPLTPAGRQRLRETALANKPWSRSTGPKTEAGKKKSAANGLWRQKGKKSLRQVKAELAEMQSVLKSLRDLRTAALNKPQPNSTE